MSAATSFATRKGGHAGLVSVVIPARDEEETLGLVLDDLLAVSVRMSRAVEVIVVDDHSRDRTAEVARRRGVRVVRNPERPGKGRALRTGFAAAGGEYIVMMDADYSHRPEDLPALLEPLEKGAGLVIGSRIMGGSEEYTRVRAMGNIIFTGLFGLLYGRYLSDALNGFKAFRREVIAGPPLSANGFDIEIELLRRALGRGLSIMEVPSHERARAAGQAKSRVVRHGFQFLWAILKGKLRW